MPSDVQIEPAIDRLMRFLSVEGITGQEAAIAKEIQKALGEVGVPASAIRFDTANERIALPTQTGNLIVNLPGTFSAPRILFMTHMDTVPLCAGAEPVRKGNRIVPAGVTALGGDNRTGCAVLVTLAAELIRRKLPHPPITLLFTVREESGLFGARNVDPKDLHEPVMAFNFDGRSAADVTIGAVGADRWEVEIFGKAAHAGVHPEMGISATMILSLAMADLFKNGWFGKIVKEGHEGTSNIGSVGDKHGRSAGEATNVVTDYILIRGESRSHDAKFVRSITAAYKAAFSLAVKEVRDHKGRTGKVKFTSRLDYLPFRIKENAPIVKHAMSAIRKLGREPNLKVTNGGLDANWMVKHGIPTITFGAGQNEIHTVNEWVDLSEFESGCRLAVALATATKS
ncbi:M20/M25/M40 family metallo-hydrolase [Telmatocola sphagniphila]|uniref:M20/M25/M40 family metallo-hydrolase n=1 Tax=Telmatocola sphagniphila TaxID=1123043 RepID=A0A8E6F0F2_9BACT|nr:M20/M25/M40 family metallo-hydrolase [Telmatocola sphagniphila]QVL34466.1 M20/M25/M40 family metallo-hydrolase [Telmatocola sphagniphila]